jgi:hypothetical protein
LKMFFDELHRYFWFDLTLSKKFEKEIVFESFVLAWIRIRNRIRNWIRIEQKCWIQIRKKSIRIHNPAFKDFNLTYSKPWCWLDVTPVAMWLTIQTVQIICNSIPKKTHTFYRYRYYLILVHFNNTFITCILFWRQQFCNPSPS